MSAQNVAMLSTNGIRVFCQAMNDSVNGVSLNRCYYLRVVRQIKLEESHECNLNQILPFWLLEKTGLRQRCGSGRAEQPSLHGE